MPEQPPLTEAALLQRVALGEHTRQQFKRTFSSPDALAAELAAFANSGGGTLLIGVNDDGSLAGLDATELRRLNQMLSNASSQHVRPPLHPHTENVLTHAGLVSVEQEGRFQRYRANLALMRELIDYLSAECCEGMPDLCEETRGAACGEGVKC